MSHRRGRRASNPPKIAANAVLPSSNASDLLNSGENIRAFVKYLGHADPAFTSNSYMHLMPSSSARTPSVIDSTSGTR